LPEKQHQSLDWLKDLLEKIPTVRTPATELAKITEQQPATLKQM